MITEFNCTCGNTDKDKAIEYDGALGYSAIICIECCRYYDYEGEHQPDKFSRAKVSVVQEPVGARKYPEVLPIIEHEGITYTVDSRMNQIIPVEDPFNPIFIDELGNGELADKVTRTLIEELLSCCL